MGYVAVQGKPLKERSFNKELVGHTTMMHFYYTRSNIFFFFYFAHEGKNISDKGETSKILRVKVSHLDFLENPGEKRANDSRKAEGAG